MTVDLRTQTDAQLDEVYNYLLGQHREAIGERKTQLHDAIMLVVAEYGRRIDQWLLERPPIPVAQP